MDILIVDDDPTTLTLLRRILVREFACGVAEAASGLAALALLGQRPFDLIITDLSMPMMTGLELIEAVRQHPPLEHLPVVVMSVERNEESVRKAIELGIAAYVVKPLDAAKVAQRLRPLVDSLPKRSAEAPAGDTPASLRDDASKPAYMLVDGNSDFRHFFGGVFSSERRVVTESTGVAAIAACLRTRPGVVFLGDDIGVLNPELLARKLRANKEVGNPRLVRITTGRLESAAPWETALDGLVRRTFVAESFRAQAHRALGDQAQGASVLLGLSTLRLDMASAAEQVFGMMMGIEVEAVLDPATELAAGAFAASQVIDWEQGHEQATFTIRVDPASARVMTARMLSMEPEQVTDEMMLEAGGEISNIVTGRLKNAFQAVSIGVVCALPAMHRLSEPWRSSVLSQAIHVRCRQAGGPVECTMTLEVPPVPGAPEAAAADPAAAQPALQGAG